MKLDLELDLKIARKAWVPLSGSPFETTGSDRNMQGIEPLPQSSRFMRLALP